MGWGHVLLYPDRLTAALEAGPQKQRFDDASDGVLALIGSGAIGQQVSEGVAQRVDIGQRVAEYFGPWLAAGGPFSGAAAKLETNADRLDQKLADLIRNLAEAPPGQWRTTVLAQLDIGFDLLAPVDARALVRFLRSELEGAIDLLKRPVRQGPRSIEAHRALRAAVAIRRMLRPAFAVLDDAEDALGQLNLKANLRLAIRAALERLELPDLERLQGMFRMLDGSVGAILRAGSGFRIEVSVDVGGPELATDAEPALRFEAQAVPHEKPGVYWTFDLVTNIMASLSTFWEVLRTAAFAKRPADGIMMLLGLIWQITRTVVRAAWPEKINVTVPETGDAPFEWKNWFFTDQADFSMNAVWRILGSLHEHHAPSNWYLSVFRRLLGYITHVTNWRMPYQWVRSLWYFMTLRGEYLAGRRLPVSPSRLLMFALGPSWFIAIIFAACMPWKDFQLEAMSGAVVAGIVVPVVIYLFGLFFLPKFLLDDFFPPMALDRWANAVMGIAAVFGAIVTLLLVGELEMGDAGMQSAITAVLIVVAVLAGIAGVLLMFDVQGLQYVFHGQAALLGLLMTAVLFFVWYFYIDDGRDQPGVYGGLNSADSPFRLPYPEGDNWLCGQGSHGIFSHTPTKFIGNRMNPNFADNHYAYDFNHEPRADGLATRAGFVISLSENEPDDEDDSNNVTVLHPSWSSAVDPGGDQERTLTFTEYVHISQGSVRAGLLDRVVQGDHLVQIDNNGRSAQHHLHLASSARQGMTDTGGNVQDVNVPMLFSDGSAGWFRNYPLLAWIGGHGQIAGKPLSMAFYTSSNPKRALGLNPRVVPTEPARLLDAAGDHQHDLLIDAGLLGGAIPATVTLRTSVDQGHWHEVTLTAAQVQAMMEWQDTPALATTDAFGHTHAVVTRAHRRVEALGAAPAITIAEPQGAFLTAETPGPYALSGGRFVLRVDEAGGIGATEFRDFPADPVRFLADIAVDVGLAPADALTMGGMTATMGHAGGRLGVRGTAGQATRRWRATVITDSIPAAHVVPVIVIESRHAGTAARIEYLAASTLPLAGAAPGVATGSGVVANGRAVPRADLAALLQAGLTAAPAPPGVAATIVAPGDPLVIERGGVAVAFTGGSSRLDGVLTALYDAANRQIASPGTLPLQPGRFGLDGITVPILARPARQRFAPTGPDFVDPGLTATPLVLTVHDNGQNVALTAADTTPEAVAARINLSADGVRARVEGGEVVVETVDGGPDASLAFAKGALTLARVTGAAPAGITLPNACAVSLEALRGQIAAAQAAGTLPYDPVAVAPAVTVAGQVIEITVAAGHTVEVAAMETGFGLAFETPAVPPGVTVRTQPLPDTVELNGSAWLDLRIDGQPVRVALDTERARLELPPLQRLPAAGERVEIAIDGGAPVAVALTGAEASVAEVAALIAGASPDLLVRLGMRLAVTDAFHGSPPAATVALTRASGTQQMGFLRDPAAAERVGFQLNANVDGRDGLALTADDDVADAAWNLQAPQRAEGVLDPALLTVDAGAAGAAITLTAAAGHEIEVVDQAGGDPFGLSALASAPTVATAAPADALPWGRRGLRQQIQVRDTAAGGRTATGWLSLQATPAVLRGVRAVAPVGPAARVLELTVTPPGGTGRLHRVDLSGVDLRLADAQERVADAVNAAAPALRAWTFRQPGVGDTRLHIETAGAGSGWRLSAGPVALAGLLGLPAELAAGATLDASGGGDVADHVQVARAELTAALERARDTLTMPSAPPPAGSGTTPLGTSAPINAVSAGEAYAARRLLNRIDHFLRFRSITAGARSAIRCLEQAGRGVRLPTDPVRAPACRGAVMIPAPAAALALDGELHIEFNEPPPGSVVVAPTLRIVTFPAGSYDAATIADRIHAAVAGTGTATLFPDGAIVVETARQGLAGAVRLPAAGTPRPVADALLGAGRALFGRGWPGVGFANPGQPLRGGLRGRGGAVGAVAAWRFVGDTRTIDLPVAVGETAEQLADKLNQAFAADPGPTGPIGLAASVDGVLFVEDLTQTPPLMFQVNGAALGVLPLDLDRPWLTPERAGEPAMDLRFTAEARTVRLTRGRAPVYAPGDVDDWGWLRIPLHADTGQIASFKGLPPGRYALDLRSDAAKATNYDQPAARVAASGTGAIVHAVRYGITVAGGSAWALHRLTDGAVVEEWSLPRT